MYYFFSWYKTWICVLTRPALFWRSSSISDGMSACDRHFRSLSIRDKMFQETKTAFFLFNASVIDISLVTRVVAEPQLQPYYHTHAHTNALSPKVESVSGESSILSEESQVTPKTLYTVFHTLIMILTRILGLFYRDWAWKKRFYGKRTCINGSCKKMYRILSSYLQW